MQIPEEIQPMRPEDPYDRGQDGGGDDGGGDDGGGDDGRVQDRTPGHAGTAQGRRRFARHYLEMVVAMVVGMVVLGAVTRGVLALAGVEYSATRHPELTSVEMAFDMSVAMAVWMRHRGHGWASTLEMCGAMFAPALALFPLLWLDVVTAESLLMLEHVVMLPLMLLVMLRRRSEYGL